MHSQLSSVAVFGFKRRWLACLRRFQEESPLFIARLVRFPNLNTRDIDRTKTTCFDGRPAWES